MPEPISSNTTPGPTNDDWSNTDNQCSAAPNAPNATEVAPACYAELDVAEQAPYAPPDPSVALLMAKCPPARLAAFLQQQAEQTSNGEANNNAQRTATSPLRVMNGEVGTTSAGDAVYAGAAAIKGHVGDASVEMWSASAQVGAQNELQAGVGRVSQSVDGSTFEVRALELEAHAGVHNPDGSTGINIGAGVTLLAAEYTLSDGTNSVTAGLSQSFGAELSIGTKDANGDGNTEYCLRGAVGPVIVGGCADPASIPETFTSVVKNLIPTFGPGGTLNP